MRRLFSSLIRKNLFYDLFDIISFLVFVGGIVLSIRFFVFNPYSVVGRSMYPTFHENDFIIVDKVSPRFTDYKRGDVIVFVPPGKEIPYIKRVIGTPGDIVKINDGYVYICHTDTSSGNCEKLDEKYLPTGLLTDTSEKTEFVVTTGGLFVMGDNRPQSTDSRACFGIGCFQHQNYLVPYDHIIGKVLVRIRPRPQASRF